MNRIRHFNLIARSQSRTGHGVHNGVQLDALEGAVNSNKQGVTERKQRDKTPTEQNVLWTV
jgi:hypothetical protein